MKNLFKKTRNIYVKFWLVFFLAISILPLSSCKKIIEIAPQATSLNSDNVFENEVTSIAVLNGIYAGIVNIQGGQGLSLACGLSADEFTLYSGVTNLELQGLYRNRFNVSQSGNNAPRIWSSYYSLIFRANSAIEGLSKSKKLPSDIKQTLIGESFFVRAFCYFNLVNLYGSIPIAITTDPEVNNGLSRSDPGLAYEQIVSDLKQAQSLLSTKFLNASLQPYASSPERVRPTFWAATALLAKSYLYKKDFANAEIESTKLIEQSGGLFALSPLNSVFLKNSTETIWSLQPVKTSRNTEDGIVFNIASSGPSDINSSLTDGNPVYLSQQLMGAFEPLDQRRAIGNWIASQTVSGTTYFYPSKYKATTGALSEYQVMFRLSEQYLIRAEARAWQNKFQAAIDDINVVRTVHGGLTPALSAPSSQSAILDIVLHERQVELFTEQGNRWMDLKRMNKVNDVMSLVKPLKDNGEQWSSYMQFYPIPFRDIQFGYNLVQTPGYN